MAKKIRNKLTDMLELPKEVVLGLPLISIIGSEEISIENYKGIIEYTSERIRINTSCGVLKIEGRNMVLKQITSENMLITGSILKFEYLI
ncbi:MAG: sporulation protein YqfC [Defluviitaleaceae bacterium]|nr:sporulation protein YqfC [Defluviitaleaceae bacterium]